MFGSPFEDNMEEKLVITVAIVDSTVSKVGSTGFDGALRGSE